MPVVITICSSAIVSWCLIMLPVLIAALVFVVVFEPYKQREQNISGILLALFLTVVGAIVGVLNAYDFSKGMVMLAVLVLTLPHCVVYSYAIYWLIKKVKQCCTTANSGEQYRPLIIH